MSQTLVFPAADIITAEIAGESARFPVRRIFCVGRNYLAHAAEMGVTVDKAQQEPFYFLKDASALVPSGATVDYPPQTANYHYEMEFVVAIGKAGFEVSEDEVEEMIFGYACGLDMTRRDLQLKARETGRPWDLGKNFEDSAVLSPIIRRGDLGLLDQGNIQLSVNGTVKQSSDLSLLIWNIKELLVHLTRFYHLQPGDLIYTGTPEGVGPVVSGDQILGYIKGVGDIELNIR